MSETDHAPSPSPARSPAGARARLSQVRRTLLNRRRLGRAIMVAAVIASITCLVGIVVAWQLVGDLAHTTRASLSIVDDTLVTVDETLDVADSAIESVDDGIVTVQTSLATIATVVENGALTLDVFADLTERLAPNLEQIDRGLSGLQSAVDVVDGVLGELAALPFGPDYDPETGLAPAVQAVREDLAPIADDLGAAAGSLRELAASSDDALEQLSVLGDDLAEIDRSLNESQDLIDRYRGSIAEAAALASGTVDELDRDVWLSRLLIVILGVAIAFGQIAPFRIGRELARTPAPPSTAGSDGTADSTGTM